MGFGKTKRKKIGKRGFTLIELIVVIAIVAVLAIVGIPTIAGLVKKAQAAANAADARSIASTAELMMLQMVIDGESTASILAKPVFDGSAFKDPSAGPCAYDDILERAGVNREGITQMLIGSGTQTVAGVQSPVILAVWFTRYGERVEYYTGSANDLSPP